MKYGLLAAMIAAILLVPLLASFVMRARGVKRKIVTVNGPLDKTLSDGIATLVAEAAFGTRYLLAGKGTASGSIILNTAATIPVGVVLDEPAIGDGAAVALLGAIKGTIPMVASKSIAENTNVYGTAGGKVTDAVVTGAAWVGKTAPGSSAAADGDRIVVIPRFPTPNA